MAKTAENWAQDVIRACAGHSGGACPSQMTDTFAEAMAASHAAGIAEGRAQALEEALMAVGDLAPIENYGIGTLALAIDAIRALAKPAPEGT